MKQAEKPGLVAKVTLAGLQHEPAARQQADQENQELALFPQCYPAPLLRIDRKAVLRQANAAAGPLLRQWRCRVGQGVPPAVAEIVLCALQSAQPLEWETNCDGDVLSFMVAPMFDLGYADLYGRDVSAFKRDQRALQEECERLRTAMDGAKDVHLAYLDRDFNLLYVNECYARSRGFAPEEIIGKNHFALYPHEENRKTFERARDTGEPAAQRDQLLAFRQQGERRITYWDWTLTCVRRPDGWVEGLVFALVETTARKRAELKRQESEQKLLQILDAASVIAWEVDLVGGGVQSEGPVARIFGKPEGFEFSTSADFLNCIHPEDLARVHDDQETAIRGSKPYHSEFRVQVSDGSVRWACAHGEVERDSAGNPIAMRGITEDITAVKLYDMALRESETRLRLAVEATDMGLWERDLMSGEVYFSPGWKQQIGYSADELPNRRDEWEERLHPEDRALVVAELEDYLQGRLSVYDQEYRLRHRDGGYRWIHSRGALVRDALGRAVRMLGLNMDVSRYKRSQEERERRAKMEECFRIYVARQTAAAIAHELHQPLTAVAAYSETALHLLRSERSYPNELVRALEHTVKQALRAGQVTKQLTEFLCDDKTPGEITDLRSVLEEAVVIARERDYPPQFRVILDLPADLPPVSANRLQIEKVLVNLLCNGLDAMRDAGLRLGIIAVSACTTGGDEPMVLVTVRDSGKGLAETIRDSIFQPFHTTKPTGLGLGLAISRTLIEANGGKLWTEQANGLGACFKFTLPLAR